MNKFSDDEQAAAAAISNIMAGHFSEKRSRDDGADDAAGTVRPVKMVRPAVEPVRVARELKPAPYFYYRDHSMETDADPLTPLTPPGRVPNFPAKMHAILGRKDFQDIVSWLPHGRSWRVLKPREFEIKVIPKFFEHAKFSSFVRQANGWGFRRITQGKDRNSYYHEQFLRGLPHLCKNMKRPGVNEKKQADPGQEPDLERISEENPVPERADDDSVLLHSTLQHGGPKARMPIYWGSKAAATSMSPNADPAPVVITHVDPAPAVVTSPPSPVAIAPAFSTFTGVSEQPVAPPMALPMDISPTGCKQVVPMPFMALPSTIGPVPTMQQQQAPQPPTSVFPTMTYQIPIIPGMDAAAASQFAAGFAAATAFSQQHFSSVLGSLAAQKGLHGQPQPPQMYYQESQVQQQMHYGQAQGSPQQIQFY